MAATAAGVAARGPTARNTASSASASANPEEQLLAWLSGTSGLQSGAAGPASAGASGAGPISTSPTAAGSTAPGLNGAEAAIAALAAELGISATGVQTAQSTIGFPLPAASSDGDASTDALSGDPSESVNALLSPYALPAHLAGVAHAGAAQQPTGVLQASLGTSAWVEELGAQLSWMVNRGIESASLHVSPAELGPIEVRIAMHGSDASIWFGAAHATTRAALEQTLPQLRQLLASHGLALADAGVFREPPRGSARQAPSRSLAPVAAVSEETSRTPETRGPVRIGLLDLYA